MTNRGYLVLQCFTVVLLAQRTLAINSYELQKLMNKLDNLQVKLHEVEQNMKTTIETSLKEIEQASKERHANLQDQLTKHEKDVKERFEKLDSKLEMKMHAAEESLKKSVETYEDKTRAKLEDLKDQFIAKIDNLQQQHEAESKTFQETTQTELMKLMPLIKLVPLRSCRQAPKNDSNKYMIQIGKNSKPFEVFCEQSMFGGGWTVIQHRFDGSIDFYRNWTEYRNGFGKLDGEFWLGLEYVHQLTKNRPHELIVEMNDFHGNYGYAKYDGFEIDSEAEMYKLKKLGTYSGTSGDSMWYNKYAKFSTFDRENDPLSNVDCAADLLGAWWYQYCTQSNLNGRYQNTTDDYRAMVWNRVKNDYRSLSYSRMMIRDIIN